MRTLFFSLCLFLTTFASMNLASASDQSVSCYQTAWEHPSNGGLGLTRGMAVELCKGTPAAKEVLQCYRNAWEHPSNGGLGMTRGMAVDFCK